MEGNKKRRIITAAEANAEKAKKTGSKPAAAEDNASAETAPQTQPTGKSTVGLRVGAILLWLLAIGFEVVVIFLLQKGGTSFNIPDTTLAIIGIVLDAICCIAGSLMWKRANRIKPYLTNNKFAAFIWNQLGVIACIVAFIPIGLILLFKADKVSPQMKKVIAVVAAIAFLGSTAASIDWNPPSSTPASTSSSSQSIELAKAATVAAVPNFDGTVYWTKNGKSYHADQNCFTLDRSETLISGTIDEAFAADRGDPCDFCAGGKQYKESIAGETSAGQ